jgi:hypothetical protein
MICVKIIGKYTRREYYNSFWALKRIIHLTAKYFHTLTLITHSQYEGRKAPVRIKLVHCHSLLAFDLAAHTFLWPKRENKS